MMLSFHKHVVPMQRASETLPFNIYPLDTVKYRPENFKEKAEQAIDDAIVRFTVNEPPGRSVGAASDALKYFSFQGLRYTDVSSTLAKAIFQFGDLHGFNLFDGEERIVFFGYFEDVEPREIAARTRFLLQNIALAYSGIAKSQETEKSARKVLDQIEIELLAPEDVPLERLQAILSNYQPKARTVKVTVKRPAELQAALQQEYDQIEL